MKEIKAYIRTGDPNDGIVFVTDVERAVTIRNRSEGPQALQS